MTGCIIGSTPEEALDRGRALYNRGKEHADFDGWLIDYRQRALIGSVDEVAARLREYEEAGCSRIMLQHLDHTDLEPVKLIGRELAPAVL
jgi:alkanesulfonate monooxygenase SsuD/methylene tetrahydromethanopterin reductase-like flavin-dependent oxidoreductase (luciferase family)